MSPNAVLKLETVFFSEMLVSTYKSTRRYSPKKEYRQLQHRENLKSNIVYIPFLICKNLV
jgi:hypothetical protein